MVTGRLPFTAPTAAEILALIIRSDPLRWRSSTMPCRRARAHHQRCLAKSHRAVRVDATWRATSAKCATPHEQLRSPASATDPPSCGRRVLRCMRSSRWSPWRWRPGVIMFGGRVSSGDPAGRLLRHRRVPSWCFRSAKRRTAKKRARSAKRGVDPHASQPDAGVSRGGDAGSARRSPGCGAPGGGVADARRPSAARRRSRQHHVPPARRRCGRAGHRRNGCRDPRTTVHRGRRAAERFGSGGLHRRRSACSSSPRRKSVDRAIPFCRGSCSTLATPPRSTRCWGAPGNSRPRSAGVPV